MKQSWNLLMTAEDNAATTCSTNEETPEAANSVDTVYRQDDEDMDAFEAYRQEIAAEAAGMHQRGEAYSALAIISAGEKEIAAYENNLYKRLDENKAALNEIFAKLESNMSALYPENGLLGATGETTRQEEHLEWKEKYSAQARVNRILSGNYVFIADGDKAWKQDQKVKLEVQCYITEKYEFYISADAANKVLGLTIDGDYINAENAAIQLGLDIFLDPRGVVVLGNNVVYEGSYDSSFEDGIVKTGYCSDIKCYADFYAIADVMGEILWEEIAPTDEDYEQYISNWQKALTVADISDPDNVTYIEATIADAQNIQASITLGDNAAGPFADYQIGDQEASSAALSQTFYLCFQQLVVMAKGYYLMPEGAEKAQLVTDIKAVLEYIYPHFAKKIRHTVTDSGKWTNYEFNIPFCFANVMALIYDKLTPEELGKYTNAVFDRDPDSASIRGSSNGSRNITNRSWVSFAYLNNAILARDVERINHALKYMTEGFLYAVNNYTKLALPKGGMFRDGSVVFHGSYPYAMGYGQQHIDNIANILLLGDGTVFDVTAVPFFENIYEIVENNFLPFFADDVKMKIVSGRWILQVANKAIAPMMILANHAPEAARRKLTQAILDTIKGYENNHQTTTRIGRAADYLIYVDEMKAFWQYADMLSYESKKQSFNRLYSSMDRVLHKFEKITVGIGMTSSRISSFEAGADGGQTDWYVNEGSVYVYNGDNKQFNQQWFKKANMHYIPGTTVEDLIKDPVLRSSNYGNLSDADWAGGVSDGINGIATMQLGENFDYNLDGYKTFFMFDDRIICLGSGIYGGANALRTVIDNRWVDKPDVIKVDGEVIDTVFNSPKTFEGKAVYLEGFGGYVLLDGNPVTINREYLNSQTFAEIYIDHGMAVSVDAATGYAYVMLPGRSDVQVAEYAEAPDVTIIENTASCQIIKDSLTGMIAGSMYVASKVEGFTFGTPCAFMLNTSRGKLYVSDPTHKLDSISITIPPDYTVTSADYVIVNGTAVTVDTSLHTGETILVELDAALHLKDSRC